MEPFHRNKERGFTLIELLVIISIIIILSAIASTQFRLALSQRELNHAASELVSDIRGMQQLAANDDTFLPATKTTQLTYLHKLVLWDITQLPATGITTNSYQVQGIQNNNITVLKEVKFTLDNVNALVILPTQSPTVNMTYYAYDLDRINGTTNVLENRSYQIKLTHTISHDSIYINVDSRVGRVWTNTNGASPL